MLVTPELTHLLYDLSFVSKFNFLTQPYTTFQNISQIVTLVLSRSQSLQCIACFTSMYIHFSIFYKENDMIHNKHSTVSLNPLRVIDGSFCEDHWYNPITYIIE